MKKFFLLLAMLMPASALGQISVWSEPILNQLGQPIPQATVAVCSGQPSQVIPCGGTLLATIYFSFAGGGQINPLYTDSFGRASIFATPGNYWLQIYGAGISTQIIPITIGGGGGGGGSGTVNTGTLGYAGYYASSTNAITPIGDLFFAGGGIVDILSGLNIGVIGTTPTACTPTSGCIAYNESSTPGTPTAGQDYCRADLVTHGILCSFNGGPEAPVGSGAGGLPVGVVNGSHLVSNGVGVSPVYRKNQVFDPADFGVTCNGSTDDTAAMQTAINAAISFSQPGATLQLPNFCKLKISSTLTIAHAASFTLDGVQAQGEASLSGGTGGPATFLWYGAAGQPVITINQTRDSTFKNFSVFTNASSNLVNGANIGILIDEIAPVTGIVTNNKFEDVQVWNGSSNSSFIGISICPTAPGNCEEQNFERLFVNCSLFAATSSNNGIGIRYGVSGGATQPFGAYLSHYQPKLCSQAIDIEQAHRLHITNGLMDHDYTDLFMNSGHGIVYEDTRSENGTAQIVIGTAGSSSLHDVELRHNSFAGLTNGTTTISFPFSTTGGAIRLIGNDWDTNATVTPFGPSGGGGWVGTVDSQDNNYPNATLCPSFFVGTFLSLNDSPGNGVCPYGGVQLFGNSGRMFTSGSANSITVGAPGAAALGTGAITSGTCASVVTVQDIGASVASTFTVNNGGSGYSVGDLLQLSTGGGGSPTGGNVKVAAVSSGVITQVLTISTIPGIAGTNISTITLSGSGTGATLDTVGDNLSWNFMSDPTGITGYAPAAGGALRIVSYLTANNVNFKVCNDTSGSITPGAAKLNWRVVR